MSTHSFFKRGLVATLAFSTILSASPVKADEPHPILGGILGAIVGNQIGSGGGRILATGVGAIIGILIGDSIGRHAINDGEQARIDRFTAIALNSGTQQTWRSDRYSEHDIYAVITPLRVGHLRDPENPNQVLEPIRMCRQFEVYLKIDGKAKRAKKLACKEGTAWMAVEKDYEQFVVLDDGAELRRREAQTTDASYQAIDAARRQSQATADPCDPNGGIAPGVISGYHFDYVLLPKLLTPDVQTNDVARFDRLRQVVMEYARAGAKLDMSKSYQRETIESLFPANWAAAVRNELRLLM